MGQNKKKLSKFVGGDENNSGYTDYEGSSITFRTDRFNRQQNLHQGQQMTNTDVYKRQVYQRSHVADFSS